MLIDELERIAKSGLYKANSIHDELGARGPEEVATNQFGETALLLDVMAEEVIIQALRDADVPILLRSEEHGQVQIGQAPRYLGILDGLDGSSVYKSRKAGGRYGTMFAIFSNLDPLYADYLFCGIMIHAPKGELLYARKGGGSVVESDGAVTPIRRSGATNLRESHLIYVDDYFEVNRALAAHLSDYHLACTGSSAIHYADVARGAADAAIECTRKQNLELAVAFGLIQEAGGVMALLDRTNLGEMRYLSFSQDAHTPVITASTPELAYDIIRQVAP